MGALRKKVNQLKSDMGLRRQKDFERYLALRDTGLMFSESEEIT